MLSDEEVLEIIANEIADRAVDEVADEIANMDDQNEIERRIIAAIEHQMAMINRMLEDPEITRQKFYPIEMYVHDEPEKEESVIELTLPPLKPIPEVDQSELDAINARVSNPKEQDRLAREFMEQFVRRKAK